MEGRQPENKSDLHDDEIIDLNDVVQGGADDDIIDLTEILDQPDRTPATADSADEEIIPLVDPVPNAAAVDASQTVDDDIIDLTDLAAEPDSPADDDSAGITLQADDGEAEEEVIDLLDVAETLESDLSETDLSVPGAPPAAASGGEEEDEEEIIDLMEVAATEPSVAESSHEETRESMAEAAAESTDEADDETIDPMAPETPAPTETEATVDVEDEFSDLESRADAILRDTTYRFDYDPEIEAAETAGPDADFNVFDAESFADQAAPSDARPDVDEPYSGPSFIPVTPSETASTGEGIVLTEQQLEAALTTAVEKIYGEKIEQLLLQTIEKTVRREIAKIKNALLEDGDDVIG